MTIISLILAFLSGVAGGILLCFHLAERSKRNPIDFNTEGDFVRSIIKTSLRRIEIDQAFVLLIKGREFRTIVWATDRQEDYFEKIRQFERGVMAAVENGVISHPCVYGGRAVMIKETREDGEAKS